MIECGYFTNRIQNITEVTNVCQISSLKTSLAGHQEFEALNSTFVR